MQDNDYFEGSSDPVKVTKGKVMDTTSYFALGAVATAIATGVGMVWSYIRSAFDHVSDMIIVKFSMDGEPFYGAVNILNSKFKPSIFRTRFFSSTIVNVLATNRKEEILFEDYYGTIMFWNGWTPLFVHFESKDSTAVTFYAIRWTVNIEKLLMEFCKIYNAQNNITEGEKRFFIQKWSGNLKNQIAMFAPSKNGKKGHAAQLMNSDEPSVTKENNRQSGSDDNSAEKNIINNYKLIGYRKEEIGFEQQTGLFSTPDNLSLSKETQSVVNEIRTWYRSKDWYKKRNIPWKRGYIFHGPPGTGKTSLTRCIGAELDLPIYIFDLNSMTNEDLKHCWNKTCAKTPCIALFEDFDNTFHGRVNQVSTELGITFDNFLNTIDGIEKIDGILVVVTTNILDKIDPALGQLTKTGIASRPGRIDRIVYMGELEREGFEKIAKRILNDYPERIEEQVLIGVKEKETAAQFENRCTALALQLYWNSSHPNQPASQVIVKETIVNTPIVNIPEKETPCLIQKGV